MLGFLGKLFGTDKAVTGIIDTVSNGLDKMVYTDEEKAEAVAASRSEARKMIIDWMRNTQGQNLARRLIALSITGVWLLQYVLAWVLDVAAIWTDPVIADKLTLSAVATGDRAETMVGAVMLILSFYFAAPHMGKIVDGAMSRFQKDQTTSKT